MSVRSELVGLVEVRPSSCSVSIEGMHVVYIGSYCLDIFDSISDGADIGHHARFAYAINKIRVDVVLGQHNRNMPVGGGGLEKAHLCLETAQ